MPVFISESGSQGTGGTTSVPHASAATERFRALFDWAGEPMASLHQPRLYAGPGGRTALRRSSGVDPSDAWHLSFGLARQFEPLHGARNAFFLHWPHANLPKTAPLDDPLDDLNRVIAVADVALAGSRHTEALLQAAGAASTAFAPPPIAPAADMAPPDPKRGAGQPVSTTIWSTERDGGELRGRDFAAFAAQRDGPIFIARTAPLDDPRAFRTLLRAAERLGAGRLVILLDLPDVAFDDVRAQFQLDEMATTLGARIGLSWDQLDAVSTRELLAAADAVVVPTSGVASTAARELIWLTDAIVAGCAPLGPMCPPLADVLAGDAASMVAAEQPAAIEKGAAPTSDRPVAAAPRPRTWTARPEALGGAMAAFERLGPAERALRAARALAPLRADFSFEAVWSRLYGALASESSSDRNLS